MDIRIALTTGASYGLSLAATLALLSLLFLATHSLVVSSSPNAVALSGLFAGLVTALTFMPLARLFQALLDRYTYRPPYHGPTVLEEVSSILPTLLHPQALYRYLDELLGRTVRPESFFVYLLQDDALHCVYSMAPPRPRTDAPALARTIVLPTLITIQAPVLRDELRLRCPELARAFATIPCDVLLPLRSPTALSGLVALGPKRSLDPYFSTDLTFLAAICRHLSIVLENARLYAQATTVKEHLEHLLDNMESGVIAVETRGTIFTSNPAAHYLLETSAAGLRGRFYDVLPPPLSTPIATVLATMRPIHQHPSLYTSRSGRIIHLLVSCSPIHVAPGPSPHYVDAGAVVVFTDNTRSHELQAARRRADRLLDFQTMAGSIAHEIKNPLVAIKTFAELLPHRFEDREFRDTFSHIAVREIERIDHLVDRLRGAAARTPLRLAPVHLPSLLSELTALLAPQLERARLMLSAAYEPNTPPVAGDPTQLHQLFLNLLLNSIEAMPSGGVLRLDVRPSPDTLRIAASVSDTGPGISPDLLDSIFDPFVSTKSASSGLGLAICRTITADHGGAISARNNHPDRGVTITVNFPAWEPIFEHTHPEPGTSP
jgi:nitrogen-specific signal transduction histidine kinase